MIKASDRLLFPSTDDMHTSACFNTTFLVPAYPGCPGKEAVKWLLLLFKGPEAFIPN